EKRVFLVILFTSFSGSLVSRIPGAVHTLRSYVTCAGNRKIDKFNTAFLSIKFISMTSQEMYLP
ncbi:hypothetical protein NQ225_16320, partial [Escherichia coli]|nr:hypothetical protein [Escherichia coli]